MIRFGVFLLFIALILANEDKATTIFNLDGHWAVEIVNGTKGFCKKLLNKSFNTSIPTTFHLDLIANNIL